MCCGVGSKIRILSDEWERSIVDLLCSACFDLELEGVAMNE